MAIYNTNLQERIASYQDKIFDAQALPNATTVTSSAFRFGKTQGQVEIEVFANTAVAIAAAQSMQIEILWDYDEAGSFSDSKEIYDSGTGGVSFSAGDSIAKYTPETDVEHYCKLKITTSADESSEKVDANIYRVAV